MFPIYPYTDLHSLNLDFILYKMKELAARIEEVKAEAVAEATENAKEYIDEQLGDIISQFNDLKHDFDVLEGNVSTIASEFNALSNYVSTEIISIYNTLDADMAGLNSSVDQKIKDAINNLYDNLATELANIKVINFFTGDAVTIQDMFNYLAMLHVSDSIDYDTMALRAKTYTQLVALNINYTNLAMHGNTLYV